MNLRKNLSIKLKEAKKLKGYQYSDLITGTGYSKSTLRYALNNGGVSLDVFQTLFDFMEVHVDISIEVDRLEEVVEVTNYSDCTFIQAVNKVEL